MLGKIFVLSGGFVRSVVQSFPSGVSCTFLAPLQMRSQSLTDAMLPVLGQHVIGFAAAEEMSRGLLHAVVLTPAVADGAGMDS